MVAKVASFTDEQLIALIRGKDQELYSEIIRRYETKLAHYLRKFIYDKDELEDVLQAVFIKIYKKFPKVLVNVIAPYGIDFLTYTKEINIFPKKPTGDWTLIYENKSHGKGRSPLSSPLFYQSVYQ